MSSNKLRLPIFLWAIFDKKLSAYMLDVMNARYFIEMLTLLIIGS